MLKNKEDIENYEEKAKYLEENGWVTWYHEDNWIRKEYFELPHGPDRAGISTDVAYKREKGIGELDDLVEVRSLYPEKDFRYRNWTTVRRMLATGLQGVEIRELEN